MYKRPILLLALSYLFGGICLVSSLPLPLRGLLFFLFFLYLLFLLWYDRVPRGLIFLMLFFPMPAALRYQTTQESLVRARAEAARFGTNLVTAEGRITGVSTGGERTVLTLSHTYLSNGYGSLETLPHDADERMRARYHRPVGTITVYLSGEREVYPGQTVTLSGRMMPSVPASNEGEFSYLRYAESQGRSGSMQGDVILSAAGQAYPLAEKITRLRRTLQEEIHALAGTEEQGLLLAVLLGNKLEMDAEQKALYQKNGISHILAVSGLHLSLLGMGSFQLLRFLGLPLPLSSLLGAVVTVFYGLLTGAGVATLRAMLMLLLRFLSYLLGRSYDALSAIALALLILLFENPMLIFHSGFQMSFLAVLSFSLASLFSLPHTSRRRALLVTANLHLFLLPLTLYHYFSFPLYSILLNLIVLPLFTLLMTLLPPALLFYHLLPAAFSSLTWLSGAAFGSSHLVFSFYQALLSMTSSLPGAYLVLGRPGWYPLFFYYAVLLLWNRYWMLPEKTARRESPVAAPSSAFGRAGIAREIRCRLSPWVPGLLLLLGLLLLPVRPPRGVTVTALDVGQGDGFVIRCGQRVITVDGGSSSRKGLGEEVLLPYLQSQGIGAIDLAILSHCDQDHISGILALLKEKALPIQALLLPAAASEDPRYDALREAAAEAGTSVSYLRFGQSLTVPDRRGVSLFLDCYFPLDSRYCEDANSHSSGLLLRYRDFSMLFTGDMPKEMEALMLDRMQALGNYPDIDVLKAGHHGSHTSTGERLLQALQPEAAILSYGEGNRYGHPHSDTLESLTAQGVRYYGTGELGELKIESDGTGYRITAPMRKSSAG